VDSNASWSIIHSVYIQYSVMYIMLMCYQKNVVALTQ